MRPTILYNPNNGITMPYSDALAAMAPNLVALTDAEYRCVVSGKTASEAKTAGVIPETIDTVPDAGLLDFCKSRGLDFSDLFEMATNDTERADALKVIRKRAAKDLARLSSAKVKG